ncbi:uncharacterized protein LOC114283172 [Camellia sinensis]|uniref:uncharacterized protein LOC114283172 n=1 Tax=Camellia sinensis TaxID=4442 RepID=UPI00103685FF|nr:uncharacterized protein LOC114283172 [Camellia sinensis]
MGCLQLYKCISKIIADRIKSFLPDLVDPVQSAFVQGKRISDNIFLSQELMRGYHKKSPSPRCTMKVDIMKAYDNVRWDFVVDVLKAVGFPSNIICWVKACMTSPFFLCGKTRIVNLCFADDLMIFCKGDVFTVKAIKDGLDEFQSLSGLSPSPNKSHIFFSGCEKKLRDDLMNVVKFNEGFLPVRCLGVPLISTKLKSKDCDQLVERITKRIKSWTNRYLSYASRAQLIKSILFSMQVYWSSLFILPKKVITAIESLFRSFFWSGCDRRKHSAKVSWEKVCSRKSEGGLGFKSLGVWNKAAIAKHVWFFFSGGEQSMWCQWVKSYLLKGNGMSAFLWFDNWHPLGSLWVKFGNRIIYDTALGMDAKEVKELIDHTPSNVIPTLGNDQIIWAPFPDGKFSINSTWNFLRKSFPKIGWARVWECIKGRLNVDWPNNPWLKIIDHVLRSTGGKTLRATISRLAFTCTMYHLWLARNNRIFSKELTPEEVVIKCIVDMVRFRMMSITNLTKHSSDSWFSSSFMERDHAVFNVKILYLWVESLVPGAAAV